MLLRYECRKLFGGKIKWLLLVLMILNAAMYYLYLIPSIPSQKKQMVYNEIQKAAESKDSLEGGLETITAEIDSLLQKQNENTASGADFLLDSEDELRLNVSNDLKNQYQDALSFYSFIHEIDTRAEKLLKFSIFSEKGSFSQRNIIKTRNDFSSLKETDVSPQNGTGLIILQKFFVTDLFVILGICLMSFQLFGRDGRSGMQKLLSVSVNGRGKLRFVQVCAVVFGVILYAALIYGSNLLQTQLTIGFPPSGAEIHGIAEYRNIAFPCTVRMYLMLFMLWKAAAAVAVAALFQAVVYRLSGNKLCWMILGAVFGLSFVLWFYLPENPVTKIFRYINIVGIFDTSEFIGDYQNLNLFKYPVGLLAAGCIAILITIGISIASIVGFAPSVINLQRQRQKKYVPKKEKKNLFFYECYKNFWIQKSGIIFFVLIVVILYRGFISATAEEIVPGSDYHYEQLSAEFIGKSGAELKTALDELYLKEQSFSDSAQFEGAQKIERQAEYILSRGDSNGIFVNERIWNKIFFDKDTELTNFMIFLIAAILSLGGLFQYEANSKMHVLIHSTINSDKVFWSKFGVSCLIGSLFTILIWVTQYAVLYMRYSKTEGIGWPVWSIEGFQEFPFNISIGGMLGIIMIQRILSGIIVAMILFFLSQMLVSFLQVTIAATLLFILPASLLIVANMDYINPLISLLRYNVEPFLQYIYAGSSWAFVFYKIPIVVYIVGFGVMCCLLWRSNKQWTKK